MAADVHQPLHVVSRVDENSCSGDRGGNDYCVSATPMGNQCSNSLHAYWDSAAGFISSGRSIQSLYRRDHVSVPERRSRP
jgi:hypothetical protein